LVAAWCIIFVGRLLLDPAQLHQELAGQYMMVRDQLRALELDRPLAYENVTVRIVKPNKKSKFCHVIPTVYFTNHGSKMLRWRMLDVSFEADGVSISSIPTSQYYLVNKGQKSWFNYPPLAEIPCPTWPIVSQIMFDLEYDNVPPTKTRAMKRIMRIILEEPPSTNLHSSDIFNEER
jgi:hypothetical protein